MAKYHPARISRVAVETTESSLAERMLWNELRVLREDGLNFRRRVPVDGHTVDFFCPKAGLVVQIDRQGDQTYETTLGRFIQNHGFAVVRVNASDIEVNPQTVAEGIFTECLARGQALFTLA